MTIKSPAFDKPSGIGVTGEGRGMRKGFPTVGVGTRVMLVYHQKLMTAEVTTVEEPDSRFVGRVVEFEDHRLQHDKLSHGDLFRFNHQDLRWIDGT